MIKIRKKHTGQILKKRDKSKTLMGELFQQAADLNEKINKLDRERLEFERKDISPELKGRENEKVKATEIRRFFADRKASRDISLDDVMSALDKELAHANENGVRVLENNVTGETVTLSNKAVSKMFSTTGNRLDTSNIGGILGKECIANIGRIFYSAIPVKTTADERHGSKNKILRYANAIQSDGEDFIVKITVKELADARKELTDIEIENNGGRDLAAYDLKVGKKNTAEGNISANKSATFPSGNDITVNDLIDFVNTYTNESIKINGTERAVRNSSGKRIARTEEGLRAFYDWFGDSKVTDNQGRPLVVYHGTNADFDTFDMSKAGKRTRNYTAQAGAWFTPDEAMAERFAPNVYPVYLKLGNPKIYKTGAVSSGDLALEQAEVDNAKNDGERYYAQRQLNYARKYTDAYDKFVADMFHANGEIPYRNNRTISYEDARLPEDTAGFMNKYKESLKSQGYDGIIIENTRADARRNGGENNTQYVVFAPEQIKSVQNRGSFSPDTGNIYYQSANGQADVSQLHKKENLTFRKISAEELKSFGRKKLLHQSPGANGHKGSTYWLAEKDGRQYYIRRSNHWGKFYTNKYLEDFKQEYPEVWNKYSAENTADAERDFLDDLDSRGLKLDREDIYGRLDKTPHNWELTGGKAENERFYPNKQQIGVYEIPQAENAIDNTKLMPGKEDFENPTKDYELPRLNKSDLSKLGKTDKPVVLKKNIIIKNKNHHPEISVNEYSKILSDTLINTTEIIQAQPRKRPDYYTFINENKDDVSVVELSEKKDNYEVVNFFKVNKKRIEAYRKKAIKDGGEIVITERKPQGAARLSALQDSFPNNITPAGDNVNNTFYQSAWHGSPYDFSEFKLQAIGSGEGNQAHGYGLYYSANKNVADSYKTTFADKGTRLRFQGKEYTVNDAGDYEATDGSVLAYGTPEELAVVQLETAKGDKQKAIAQLREAAEFYEKIQQRNAGYRPDLIQK